MLKAMIIEDNRDDADRLQRILEELQPKLTFIICDDGMDAIKYLERAVGKVDIFFVDRELPEMDGFTFAEKIREMQPYVLTPIVFVTGHAMHQLEAFQEYHCYSYIVKPLQAETVKSRIGSLLKQMGVRPEEPRELKKVLTVSTKKGMKLISARDIMSIEVIGRSCYIYTKIAKFKLLWHPLDKVLSEINEQYCVRCHKSFAVNLENVNDIVKARRNIWKPVFDCNVTAECEISKTFYAQVIEQFRQCLVERE